MKSTRKLTSLIAIMAIMAIMAASAVYAEDTAVQTEILKGRTDNASVEAAKNAPNKINEDMKLMAEIVKDFNNVCIGINAGDYTSRQVMGQYYVQCKNIVASYNKVEQETVEPAASTKYMTLRKFANEYAAMAEIALKSPFASEGNGAKRSILEEQVFKGWIADAKAGNVNTAALAALNARVDATNAYIDSAQKVKKHDSIKVYYDFDEEGNLQVTGVAYGEDMLDQHFGTVEGATYASNGKIWQISFTRRPDRCFADQDITVEVGMNPTTNSDENGNFFMAKVIDVKDKEAQDPKLAAACPLNALSEAQKAKKEAQEAKAEVNTVKADVAQINADLENGLDVVAEQADQFHFGRNVKVKGKAFLSK